MLKKIGAVDFATTIAPGMRDVLLTGKVMEATTRERRKSKGLLYDAVVLDAPPTGRIARFLNVNTEVAALARMGPVRGQADSVMALLRSARTAVHLVTILEEMPVQETVDGIAELKSTGLPVGAVLVNMVRQPLLPDDAVKAAMAGSLDRTELSRGLKAAGVTADKAAVDGLVAEAVDHAGRVQLEQRELATLTGLGRPTYRLPLIGDATELSGLHELTQRLADEGMV
jgi:anion-transporting  ArsA/GET3 family ATPase